MRGINDPMEDKETIYVCVVCGKTASEKEDFNDVSCLLNCVKCYKDSLEYVGNIVVKAEPVTPTNHREDNEG